MTSQDGASPSSRRRSITTWFDSNVTGKISYQIDVILLFLKRHQRMQNFLLCHWPACPGVWSWITTLRRNYQSPQHMIPTRRLHASLLGGYSPVPQINHRAPSFRPNCYPPHDYTSRPRP